MNDGNRIHTVQEIAQFINYCASTGIISWKERPGVHQWNGRFAGRQAGCINAAGYRVLMIDGQYYLAHRVARAIIDGRWPNGQVDHIDGCRSNNRSANLRIVTQPENCWNAKRRRDNSSGCKGVSWSSSIRKWRVRLTINGERILVGTFDNLASAISAAGNAREKLHGQFARHQ